MVKVTILGKESITQESARKIISEKTNQDLNMYQLSLISEKGCPFSKDEYNYLKIKFKNYAMFEIAIHRNTTREELDKKFTELGYIIGGNLNYSLKFKKNDKRTFTNWMVTNYSKDYYRLIIFFSDNTNQYIEIAKRSKPQFVSSRLVNLGLLLNS